MWNSLLNRLKTLLLPLLLFTILSSATPGQGSGVVPLKTREFYIAGVEDSRSTRAPLRIWITGKTDPGKAILSDLPGGSFSDIREHVYNSFTKDQSLRPVVIQVRQITVSESGQETGRIRGEVQVTLDFLLRKENELLPLTTFSGGTVYHRGLTGASVPGFALDRAISEGMKYFHTWMNRESSTNIKLARRLKFHFREHQVQHDDTVYYSSDRPLTWADFRDTPRNNRFGAEVFAGFGFDQESYIDDGVVHVTITTRVFVPKSGSWVRPDSRNSRALNHEQRHFDVAKIIAERFRKEILDAGLTLDNYEGFLGPHYLETLRAMNNLQTRYDGETRHGNDHAMQENWNHKIDQELRDSGVKN